MESMKFQGVLPRPATSGLASKRQTVPDTRPPMFVTSSNSNNNKTNEHHHRRVHPEKEEDKRYNYTMFPGGAGHQLDLNHLWQQVQELSAVLAANRESTVGLVKKADEIRVSNPHRLLSSIFLLQAEG